jgi:chromosome segregation ATPase
MRINELGKRVSEWEAKLKQQQQLYESVRSDRNLYSKTLIEAQDEIAEMKRKFKIMNHQIEQLKVSLTLWCISTAAVAVEACSSDSKYYELYLQGVVVASVAMAALVVVVAVILRCSSGTDGQQDCSTTSFTS